MAGPETAIVTFIEAKALLIIFCTTSSIISELLLRERPAAPEVAVVIKEAVHSV